MGMGLAAGGGSVGVAAGVAAGGAGGAAGAEQLLINIALSSRQRRVVGLMPGFMWLAVAFLAFRAGCSLAVTIGLAYLV